MSVMSITADNMQIKKIKIRRALKGKRIVVLLNPSSLSVTNGSTATFNFVNSNWQTKLRTQTGKRNIGLVIKLSVLFIVCPIFCFANMGGALFMFSFLHLVILNFFIAWVESRVLKKYNVSHNDTLIYYANFFSMAVGYFCLGNWILNNYWGTLRHIPAAMLALFTCYLATLILEYPFFYWSLKDKSQLKKLNISFFVGNTITNFALAVIYYCLLRQELSY